MEDHSRLKINSRDQQFLGTSATVTTRARQSLTLDDRCKLGKPNLSYADLHCEITKNMKDISPKHSGNFLKHCGKAKEEELVKFMSNLPSYLERGENPQEKVLNVGVLDWGRLEKWQCSQKHISQRSSRHSHSSAYSSSSLSMEGSSVDCSRGQSCSPAYQRMRRPSLQSHIMSSPVDVHPKDFKSSGESIQKFQDVEDVEANTMKEQEKFIRTDLRLSNNCSEFKLDHCKRKDSGLKINAESGTFNGANFEAMQSMKVKKNTRDGKIMKRVNKLQEQKVYAIEQGVPQTCKRVTLLMPRDLTQGENSLISESTILGQKAAEASRRSFLEMPNDISPGVVSSDVPHSCPLPCEIEERSETKWCSSDSESISVLPISSHLVPNPTRIGSSPFRGRISEIKSTTITINPASKESSTGLDPKLSKAAAEKPRSTSPFRRLSIGMGKIGKSFSSKEAAAIPQLSTTHNSVKFPSENAKTSSCQSNSSEMQSATSRARSSPLRRLLDPLLKPRAPNCHHYEEPLQRDVVSPDRAYKSSNGRLDSSTGARQPGIVKFDMASCREINIDKSTREKKQGSSTFQALLRVAVKNGQPLFTFAVDNECNIFAATMKTLSSSRDDDYSCIYTFFAIREVKKKNGRWINQGGKGHNYIHNVVAQLKVSGSQFSCMTRENYVEQSFAREFVLFAVDLRQAEQQTLDFQPNDELAAIVVKIPKVINRNTGINRHWTGKCDDFPEEPAINKHSMIDATVILPSGVHTLPNKGGPSSLIQRWRSGGSCDCGGWDLGCKLRIFANQKKSNTSKACSITDKFAFVAQGGEEENQPVFSLAHFKDGIYSVEFTSSLSIVQAFSVCIAVLESEKLWENTESSNLCEGKTSLETILAQNDGTRALNRSDGDVPAGYVSYPPHSPVGRV